MATCKSDAVCGAAGGLKARAGVKPMANWSSGSVWKADVKHGGIDGHKHQG